MPVNVTCYLILLLRYAGSMSYFICDGAGYHITCIPCVGFSVSASIGRGMILCKFNRHTRLPEDGFIKKPKHVRVLNNLCFIF